MIELLVVIAVILILVAMLLPALEQGRYKAIQVVDVGRFKSLFTTLSMFAEDSDELYPAHGAAHWIKRTGYQDIRPQLEPYVGADGFNAIANDPLAPAQLDYYNHTTSTNIFYPTTIWGGSADTMSPKRVGEDWPLNGYRVLGGDYNQDWGRLGSHAGRNGFMTTHHYANTATYFGSVWSGPVAVAAIGPVVVDHAYLYLDGHVRLFMNVSAGHPDFVNLPSTGDSATGHFIPIVE